MNQHNNSEPGPNNIGKKLTEARLAAHQLVIFRGLLSDPIIAEFLHLLDCIDNYISPDELLDTYHSFYHSLLCEKTPGATPDAWQRYLVQAILADENAFSLAAEISGEQIDQVLLSAAEHDLHCLQKLFLVDSREIALVVAETVLFEYENRIEIGPLPTWGEMAFAAAPASPMCDRLALSHDWRTELAALIEHYHNQGTGIFARNKAFRWHKGSLLSISAPDKVVYTDLIGLRAQQEQLAANTECFLKRLPASNVLLYGKRGTGKSSMVKATLMEYAPQGLRLIEVPKDSLHELPGIAAHLRGRAFRFIIFIDDLSFEEYEVDYKLLKAILEGGIEPLPENVLVYATSNRRHLVKERFSDRNYTDEIHQDDTLQEKLSVADRFGMTILFPSPNQTLYLEIVNGLACQHNIEMDPAALESRALQWEKRHNGPSGRTARQFVNQLIAERGKTM
ncbi:MAG: ATP-binding protein [Candidatus Saccharibacteria bacterium]